MLAQKMNLSEIKVLCALAMEEYEKAEVKQDAVLPTTFMIFSSNAATLFKIGVPAPSEVSWSWTASTKMSVLGHFLDFRKNVFRPRLRPLRVIHPWKAVDVQLLMQKTKNIFLNSLQFQIFGDAHGQTFHMTWVCMI